MSRQVYVTNYARLTEEFALDRAASQLEITELLVRLQDKVDQRMPQPYLIIGQARPTEGEDSVIFQFSHQTAESIHYEYERRLGS
ncbi:hypothetical protein K3G63_22290 [Hymenobacter sp. HSC-4F20]|uniref:hypothetical protein n=1 Tax=Hymenobacter sp. HSC-4F20 TaxID=2864135 RepID=UPI001C73D26A|nr:hypothetical protein [Hymenobacter sp. HSC-4F20]MBX0293191.1 hypothetical protein [Hymenobacter sp. HSC-4F20]